MCEALGYNKAIYGEIDNIYKKKNMSFTNWHEKAIYIIIK